MAEITSNIARLRHNVRPLKERKEQQDTDVSGVSSTVKDRMQH